ncbi:hypothetical protein ABLE68_03410 [Nocardioides sp. CN2-186]|uniref:hypothetical protein n=1 Tax=Nocardioides tweenelious TaxID=3156607 RepID=UPI0032B42AA4
MTEQTLEQPTTPPPVPPTAAPETPRPRLRDRRIGLPLLIVGSVMALLLAGVVGGFIGYAVHGDGPDGPGQIQRGGMGGPGQGFAPPNGQQGGQQAPQQVQPQG